MRFTLCFSPCPNDTFIFDALVNKKIDTQGLDFDVMLEDVQTLNEWARQGKLDITKISYGVLPVIQKKYIVLESGGALGKGVGPLLITKYEIGNKNEVDDKSITIPGKDTTAHLLFSLAFPKATNKKFMIFSAIEEAVLKGETDCGVIIHENRFTYQQKGLIKVMDLGEYWETQTGYPIPLGGIVMKRTFDATLQQQVNNLIKKSIEYAFANYPSITNYVKQHSQEMSESIMRQHIDLYVNNYSLQLGEDGKAAVEKFLEIYNEMNQAVITEEKIFSEP